MGFPCLPVKRGLIARKRKRTRLPLSSGTAQNRMGCQTACRRAISVGLFGILPMAGRYDVFLCHNKADKPAVEELADRLHAAGL